MKEICMYICMSIILISCVFFTYFFFKEDFEKDTLHTRMENFIVTTDTKIQELQRVEALYDLVKNMDIESYHKEKILKCVDFEIDMMKREVIMNLGKQKYEEMKGKK